jgi:hypothetical protein
MTSLYKSAKKKTSQNKFSKRSTGLQLSELNADQFQRLRKFYSNVDPQILFNEVFLLGLGRLTQSVHIHPIAQNIRSSDINPHLSLQSEPFAEFHGLVFKKHTAIDHAFPLEQAEVKTQTNTYALDEPGS